MPVNRDIRLLEQCATDKSTMQMVAEIVLPRALNHRKGLIKVARVCESFDQVEYEGALTDAARIRLAVSRFIMRYRWHLWRQKPDDHIPDHIKADPRYQIARETGLVLGGRWCEGTKTEKKQ